MTRLSMTFVFVWLALGPGTTLAQSLPEGAKVLGEATVVSVVDGDTVVISPMIDGANEIRLVGLQAPKLPLGRVGFQAWPLADESKAALEALTLNRIITAVSGGAQKDRHGRLLAHMVLKDGTWVQGALLADGWARVYSFPDNRWAVDDMLRLERTARAASVGIWNHPFYAVRAQYDLKDLDGSFHLIEGQVRAAQTVKGRTYLNFGANWKTDFTVTIEKRDHKKFKQTGLDLESLAGTWIRVRGWLSMRNGPTIRATHPEQIEILD